MTDMRAADVAGFNGLPDDEARRALAACLDVPGWVEALAAGRPWPDAAALFETAGRLARGLPLYDVDRALARHPRIGRRPAGEGREDDWSRAEQAGVTADDARAFERANREYEARFGHIYLVCARGRSGAELLADLESRMPNGPEAELRVVREELARIAELRLAELLAAPAGEAGR